MRALAGEFRPDMGKVAHVPRSCSTQVPACYPPPAMNSTTALAAPLAAGLALVTGLVGVLGPRFDLIAPIAGFGLFAVLMPLGAALALLLGLIGMLRTRSGQRRGGASQAWGGFLLSTVILGWVFVLSYGTTEAPPIHDITTNIDDPPTFVAAASEDSRGAGFAYPSGGAQVPDLQRQGYPDLATLHLDISPREALRRVRRTAEDMDWEPVGADDGSGRIEFADTTPWFRFVDFVAVRVRAEEAGTAIDVRSVSQVGVADGGKNADRIRRFLDRLGRGYGR